MEKQAHRERPILFSGEMVRAILDGRKTMTRRIVKPIPMLGEPLAWCAAAKAQEPGWVHIVGDYRRFCPYGQPGDRLWVRETWKPTKSQVGDDVCTDTYVRYRADDSRVIVKHLLGGGISDLWRPSISMPRWASRLNLDNAAVRVERLQDISEADAVAEGIELVSGDYNRDDFTGCWRDYTGKQYYWNSPIDSFHSAWDSINGKRASWESNPWVWVIEFNRVIND